MQTDASSVGLGAVLEQNGHVVAYASRALSKAEQQYSVIQKECLAAVFAMKQFRHYLLGRHFQLLTDLSPITMAVCLKDGGPSLEMGISDAGAQLHYKIP